MLGGGIAVTVSVLVLPEHTHELGLEAGARILHQLADALPKLLTGFTQQLDVDEVGRIQNEIGQRIAGLQAHAAMSKGERLLSLLPRPDLNVLLRSLLRLRHDLVMIGRAAVAPLPDNIAKRLRPFIERIAASAGDYLDESATALVSRRSAPSLDSFKSALEAYTSEITALRNEGAMRSLSISELERLFALGFALEQLEQNLSDLDRCMEELSREAR
jgi:hypothetical protein